MSCRTIRSTSSLSFSAAFFRCIVQSYAQYAPGLVALVIEHGPDPVDRGPAAVLALHLAFVEISGRFRGMDVHNGRAVFRQKGPQYPYAIDFIRGISKERLAESIEKNHLPGRIQLHDDGLRLLHQIVVQPPALLQAGLRLFAPGNVPVARPDSEILVVRAEHRRAMMRNPDHATV